jgi:radical SAM superfamily enzyme YgiQ (UPF0313 family)
MSRHRKPTILVAYPSCFFYLGGKGREQVKSSQLLLASYLSHHFPVTYMDFELLIGRPESTIQVKRFARKAKAILADLNFDILALSCWTSLSYLATMTIARACCELYPDRMIVVGGYHPTARPDDFVTKDRLFDYVVRGEGEFAMKEIADAFSTTGRPAQTGVVVGQALEPEDYVGMNWDLVDELVETNYPEGLGTLVTFLSRGCPFGCTFCMETMKTRRWRPASIEYALNEVQMAADRFKFAGLGFGDACFGVRAKWRKEFLRRLVELKPSFWILLETRPEYLDDEDIELLGQMKSQVQIGVESCSPDMLRIMNKTKQPEKYLTAFLKASHRLSDHGVVHGANLVFNHPGETQKTLEETFAAVDQELDRGRSSLIWTCHGYAHFPGSFVDNNRAMYEQKYGTKFLNPEWWKVSEEQYHTGRQVIPSHDLAGELQSLWKDMFEEREQQMRDALTLDALNLAAGALYEEWRSDPRLAKI